MMLWHHNWWHGDRIVSVYLWQEQTGGTQSKETAQGRLTQATAALWHTGRLHNQVSDAGLHVWFGCRAAWGPGTEGQPILIFSLSLCPKRRFLQNLQICWYYLLWVMFSLLCGEKHSVLCRASAHQHVWNSASLTLSSYAQSCYWPIIS